MITRNGEPYTTLALGSPDSEWVSRKYADGLEFKLAEVGFALSRANVPGLINGICQTEAHRVARLAEDRDLFASELAEAKKKIEHLEWVLRSISQRALEQIEST